MQQLFSKHSSAYIFSHLRYQYFGHGSHRWSYRL